MNPNILSEFASFLNQQIILQETLLTYLDKADAQLEVLLGSDFHKIPTLRLYNFLWGLSDIIRQASKLNESLLDTLLQRAALFDPAGGGAPGGMTLH